MSTLGSAQTAMDFLISSWQIQYNSNTTIGQYSSQGYFLAVCRTACSVSQTRDIKAGLQRWSSMKFVMGKKLQVQAILEKRVEFGQVTYKVKWKYHPVDQATWVPEKNLTSCPNIIKSFNQASGDLPVEPSGKNQLYQKKREGHNQKKEKVRPINMQMQRPPIGQQRLSRIGLEEIAKEKKELQRTARIQQEERDIQFAKDRSKAYSQEKPRRQKDKRADSDQRVMHVICQQERKEPQTYKIQTAARKGQKGKDWLRIIQQQERKNGIEDRTRILSMFLDKKGGQHFKVLKGGSEETVSREYLLAADPVAIVEYYQKYLSTVSS